MTTIAPPRGGGISERLRSAIVGLDWILLFGVAAISTFSVFVVGKTTEDDVPGDPRFYMDRQILFTIMGVVLMVVATRISFPKRR